MNKLFSVIFLFTMITIFGFFISVFIFQVGDELILTKINNVTQEVGANIGISSQMSTHIDDSLTSYRNLIIPYDLFFLLGFITTFLFSLFSAFKSKEQSWFSFFGTITFGLIIFLFITGFIVTIKDWIVLNLIQNVLSFDLNTTPIFFFYIDNLGMINFIWAIVLILVNKLNFTINRNETDITDFSNPQELNRGIQK